MRRDPAAAAQANRSNSKSGADIETILERAVEIADSEGLHSLTLRRLAQENDLGTMTLYNFFESKGDLLQNMADYILSRFEPPTGQADNARDYIRLLTHEWHRMMIRHPTIVQLILNQVTTRPAARQASFEQPLRDLRDLGLNGEQAVRVYGFTVTYALGFSAYQLPRPWGFEPDLVPDVAEQRRQQSLLMQSLPMNEYPTIVENAELIVSLPTIAQFEWGLEVFLDGLEEFLNAA